MCLNYEVLALNEQKTKLLSIFFLNVWKLLLMLHIFRQSYRFMVSRDRVNQMRRQRKKLHRMKIMKVALFKSGVICIKLTDLNLAVLSICNCLNPFRLRCINSAGLLKMLYTILCIKYASVKHMNRLWIYFSSFAVCVI